MVANTRADAISTDTGWPDDSEVATIQQALFAPTRRRGWIRGGRRWF